MKIKYIDILSKTIDFVSKNKIVLLMGFVLAVVFQLNIASNTVFSTKVTSEEIVFYHSIVYKISSDATETIRTSVYEVNVPILLTLSLIALFWYLYTITSVTLIQLVTGKQKKSINLQKIKHQFKEAHRFLIKLAQVDFLILFLSLTVLLLPDVLFGSAYTEEQHSFLYLFFIALSFFIIAAVFVVVREIIIRIIIIKGKNVLDAITYSFRLLRNYFKNFLFAGLTLFVFVVFVSIILQITKIIIIILLNALDLPGVEVIGAMSVSRFLISTAILGLLLSPVRVIIVTYWTKLLLLVFRKEELKDAKTAI